MKKLFLATIALVALNASGSALEHFPLSMKRNQRFVSSWRIHYQRCLFAQAPAAKPTRIVRHWLATGRLEREQNTRLKAAG
jgi:hypothetical protein